jgi:DNA-binding response OmpR family regulator
MKLLVIEDNRDTSDGVCEYFREAGYEVYPAYDGVEVSETRFLLISLTG